MFEKILIANRGEIACRIISTARKMGIRTVAVYSVADKFARFVQMADEAALLGPAPSRDSYLRGDKIIEIALRTGAQAIHPGYGFLSEKEDFARKVEEAGLVFIGPKASSIAAMGDKIASRKLAHSAGVNIIPGCNDPVESPEKAVEIARGIGYPVMIKASAGGGGKGLRVAFSDREAAEGFESCRNEARNSFGDDRIFIEKFVEEPRHIEIQVLGDSFGNVIHLNERECSIQRRHQKVIEEAPSPFIREETRRAMGAQAVALARAVQYQSAGTVEFVVGRDQSFYFLEMNTRLQVEHPVTECITRLDLVEQMIRIAAGEKLPITQDEVRCDGWAIECRINAEDPTRNFLPSTGRLVLFNPPMESMFQGDTHQLFGVRVDTGVYEGGEIPMHYDSMIAKLIVHGKDRQEAITMMREALNGFLIRGISSNVPFQTALLVHPDFISGNFNTGFVGEHYADGFNPDSVAHEDTDFLIALAAFSRRRYHERASRISGQFAGHEFKMENECVVVVMDNVAGNHRYVPATVSEFSGDFKVVSTAVVSVNGKSYNLRIKSLLGDIRVRGDVNGKPFYAQVERGGTGNPLSFVVTHNGSRIDAMALSPKDADLYRIMLFRPPADMSKFLLSPMPGLLTNVAVEPGQRVESGQRLAVIEAMKMENTLVAARAGVVSKILAQQGDSLAVDQVIMEFE